VEFHGKNQVSESAQTGNERERQPDKTPAVQPAVSKHRCLTTVNN